MYNFSEIKEKVKEISKENNRMPMVAFAQAAGEIALKTVKLLNELDLGRATLFGNQKEIVRIGQEIGLNFEKNVIVNCDTVPESAARAVEACKNGEADVLCKGQLHTNVYLRAILNRDRGMRTGQTLSSITAVESKALGRMILASDCAMIVNPNMDEKIAIVNNCTELANALGKQNPKVAMLSAVEELNANMPDGYDSAIVTQMNRRGQIKGCIVDGPLSLDLAISPFSAENKGINSPVAGHADVLVMPNLQAGNIFWKSMTYLAYSDTGAIVTGAQKPVVLTSRSDSAKNKVDSIAMALLLEYYRTGLLKNTEQN